MKKVHDGRTLLNYLVEVGISQNKLSEMLGVSRQQIRNYIQTKNIGERVKSKIFNVLLISEAEFYKRSVNIEDVADPARSDFITAAEYEKKNRELIEKIAELHGRMLALESLLANILKDKN